MMWDIDRSRCSSTRVEKDCSRETAERKSSQSLCSIIQSCSNRFQS
jgi:hypothetical protein